MGHTSDPGRSRDPGSHQASRGAKAVWGYSKDGTRREEIRARVKGLLEEGTDLRWIHGMVDCKF